MQKISTKAKQAIVEKVLAKDGRTLSEIAKAHNIGRSTLSKWLKHYRHHGRIEKQGAIKSIQDCSISDRFHHLMATASLDESSEHAANLITQACLDEKISQEQLILHSDNGAPMIRCDNACYPRKARSYTII